MTSLCCNVEGLAVTVTSCCNCDVAVFQSRRPIHCVAHTTPSSTAPRTRRVRLTTLVYPDAGKTDTHTPRPSHFDVCVLEVGVWLCVCVCAPCVRACVRACECVYVCLTAH